jgi:hypothetical protein
MADQAQSLAEFIKRIPMPDEIKDRLAENLHEAKLLRQLLKIAEQREAVEEVSSCK